MPNIQSLLKSEIARIARKEIKAEVETLKKAVGAQRSLLAGLKKRTDEAERQLKLLGRGVKKASESRVQEQTSEAPRLRFSAKGLKSKRQSLGLSAEQMGLLLGATGQSVYKWEDGRARPRAAYLPAIAAVRKMGKREAAAQLEALQSKKA